MSDNTIYRCSCGAITGQACEWSGPLGDLVVVETMPEWLRESHRAAGNSGSYPHNGAHRYAVERSCAARIADGWTRVVGASAATYAEVLSPADLDELLEERDDEDDAERDAAEAAAEYAEVQRYDPGHGRY